MLQIQNLIYHYPKSDFQLTIPSLSVEKGERVAIIGPSGFGKTTLLQLIAGIFLPENGSIRVNGREVPLLKEAERRNLRIQEIGFVFQDFKLIEYLKVIDNILLPFRINRKLPYQNGLKSKAQNLATSLGIGDKLNKYPSKLSQGERQRVAIGRALIHQPHLILADEPTGNLDPKNKRHIMHLLFEYSQQQQATLLTVTHDYELLSGFDRVIDLTELTT
ncbi:ABC transporter ATP-binding protein [Rapidithrix thailandica]|uniref:ABC transporter ATP-binding protein n=1 Tax=Rapidithrix thailandica TaxID=413964 RepID=A0AAW9RXE6_9BACT